MHKRLITALAAAATMSVPLAGAAWAEPKSVGADGQGGESSSQHANGPKSNPDGTDNPVSPGAQGGLLKDTELFGVTFNKDAGTDFAGRVDITVQGFSGTASGTVRETPDGVPQQRGHFTGIAGDCSGLCP